MSKTTPARIIGLCLYAMAAYGMADTDAGLTLLSEQEAAALRLDANTKIINATVRGAGPRINIESPLLRQNAEGLAIAETNPEAMLVALFTDKDKVDMGRLEVEFRNGNRVVSLTNRLRPYLTENKLDARHLRIPPGRFEMVFRIEDKKGQLAEKNYVWIVKN
ncbi:MAG: hypothetical protein NTV43_01220 [Methylococcales bacterium]|nr:hypothetical protein [Methylococcales bacterium]